MSAKPSYPDIVKRAIKDQKSGYARIGVDMPRDLKKATLRTVELLSAHAAAEHTQAASVILNTPAAVFSRREDQSAYPQDIVDMVMRARSEDGVAHDDRPLIEINSALFVAHGENLVENLKKAKTLHQHAAEELSDNITNYLEDRVVFEKLIPKGLLDAENALIQQARDILTKFLLSHNPAPKQKPKPPRP